MFTKKKKGKIFHLDSLQRNTDSELPTAEGT